MNPIKELTDTFYHLCELYQIARNQGIEEALEYDNSVTTYRHPTFFVPVWKTSYFRDGRAPETEHDLGIMTLEGVDLKNLKIVPLPDARKQGLIREKDYFAILKRYNIIRVPTWQELGLSLTLLMRFP